MSESSLPPADQPTSLTGSSPATEDDIQAIYNQLGRLPRGRFNIANRCIECGVPRVVETPPMLDDGTPFPTTFYLTCPWASSRIGTLEGGGLMKDMTDRLELEKDTAAAYQRAHEDYLQRRSQLGDAPILDGVSAGGMPTRVKCLHVVAGHSLAAGPGINPFGDEVLDLISDTGRCGPCVRAHEAATGKRTPAVRIPETTATDTTPETTPASTTDKD